MPTQAMVTHALWIIALATDRSIGDVVSAYREDRLGHNDRHTAPEMRCGTCEKPMDDSECQCGCACRECAPECTYAARAKRLGRW